MRKAFLLLILAISTNVFVDAQKITSSFIKESTIGFKLTNGVLSLQILTENAVRIRFTVTEQLPEPSLIINEPIKQVIYQMAESSDSFFITTTALKICISKKNSNITLCNAQGVAFLKEKSGSRVLMVDSVLNEKCFIAEQQFESPEDEYLYGLGQFQDGRLNIRGLTRKLTQVNSQISIPFLYSNKGYGLLWHQYGLTDFNPADNYIELIRQTEATAGTANLAEVTTSAGTQKIDQNQALYIGKCIIPSDGKYSVFLDLGDMDNRHLLFIDDKAVIDQENYWLPPTQGTIIQLKAGEHSVKVICKASNTPKVSWRKTDNTTTFRSPNANAIDYIVFYGPEADNVISTYRNLSGNVPMLPLWAFGFWQCRERYTSSKHLIETVEEFRKRKLPLDVIVQDWQYWGKYGWGAMKFDEQYYPDPVALTTALHNLNAHFSVSVWENVDKNSEVGKSYTAQNLYMENSPWLDMLNPETRKAHWNALNKNLFSTGVDSWWMDATEPENDALHNKKTFLGAGDFYRLTYPLFVSQAIYEGQRKTTHDKRVCILTRSAFAGQQRYGTINWSGDINGTWDGFRRQIDASLGYSITGMPYWTTDIGGFFRPGPSQYSDTNYQELLTRWFQWSVFNPIFRMHGYQTETEIWKYGKTFEQNARLMLDLRYQLIPYIYSEAWQISKNGSTMMRPLVMDFPEDTTALNQLFEYMFGKAFLVAPITESNVLKYNVYLPKSAQWYDFWSGKFYQGGQIVSTAASPDKIPSFVRAGSIIPLGKPMQYTNEKKADTLEIRVYQGADAFFELYEDQGDNYNYEEGQYALIPFRFNETKKVLTIGAREGNYIGMLTNRVFNIVFVTENSEIDGTVSFYKKTVSYNGQSLEVPLSK